MRSTSDERSQPPCLVAGEGDAGLRQCGRVLGRVRKPSRNAVIPSGICPVLLSTPAGCVVGYMILKTIVPSIAAATIALAAPAYADNSKTVCPSMGNGITHAQENCPQAPGHHQAPGTYNGYLLPRGYGGRP
jgi:hypothetical protein